MFQESHAEGERLKNALTEKTEDLQRLKLQSHTDRDGDQEQDQARDQDRAEAEELRARVQALEMRRTELLEQLEDYQLQILELEHSRVRGPEQTDEQRTEQVTVKVHIQ